MAVSGEGLGKLARIELLRARHRVLMRRVGRDVPLRKDERAACHVRVLNGEPLQDVATRFGLTLRRLRVVASKVWPDLMPGKALREPVHVRRCRRCDTEFTPDRNSSPKVYCGVRCANQGPRFRVKLDTLATSSQEARGAPETTWGGPAELEGASRAATGRRRPPGAT